MEKDPLNWAFETWLLALGMAVLGGLVNWLNRIRQSKTRIFNLVELIGEIMTSGFVGLGVFMLAQAFDQPLGVCAALSGIGGHMATRLLFLAETMIEDRIKNRSDNA